jgi:hypothetical protein
MVTFKLTNSEGKTSEITSWSCVNPITGETVTFADGQDVKCWKYYIINYTSKFSNFKIKITGSDKNTDYYIALQAAGGKAGEKSDSGAAGGGGGGQLYSRKIAGGDTITINVTLTDISDSSDSSTITVNSGNTVVVGNGEKGYDGNTTTFTAIEYTPYEGADTSIIGYEIYVGDGSNGGSGGNVTQQADLDDTNTPGYIYGGGGGNASYCPDYHVWGDESIHYPIKDAGKDGTPGNGYNSASDGTTGDDASPGSYSFTFADETSATTCSGGKAGVTWDALHEITNVTDAKAGNTPWFLIYFIETLVTLSSGPSL